MKCESLVEIRFGNRVAMSEKALMVEKRRAEESRGEKREGKRAGEQLVAEYQ